MNPAIIKAKRRHILVYSLLFYTTMQVPFLVFHILRISYSLTKKLPKKLSDISLIVILGSSCYSLSFFGATLPFSSSFIHSFFPSFSVLLLSILSMALVFSVSM